MGHRHRGGIFWTVAEFRLGRGFFFHFAPILDLLTLQDFLLAFFTGIIIIRTITAGIFARQRLQEFIVFIRAEGLRHQIVAFLHLFIINRGQIVGTVNDIRRQEIIRLVVSFLRVLLRNSQPRMGMSPSNGIF